MRQEFSTSWIVLSLLLASGDVARAIAQQTPSDFRPVDVSTFVLSLKDTAYNLPHQFLIERSETVVLDSLAVLVRGKDYLVDYRRGIIVFSRPWIERVLLDTSRGIHRVSVTYERYPFTFKERYYNRELIISQDTARGDTIRVSRPAVPLSLEEIFGPKLQKSGSLVRGINLGSNRDLSVTSGFRMQLSGKIASDVEVLASLTDENTPIQPEGNTQTLQEIDKVSVEVRSPNASATLGDFIFATEGTEFGRLNRKLQGAKGEVNYRIGSADGSSSLLGAVTKGKFHTNEFQGIEGSQGPYRLGGKNGERNIIIIAGTEKVYIDGELMTRGETNDYTIDYASAEITFRPRRLVTSSSRIVVDFEYSDRFYSRSLLVGRSEAPLGTEDVRVFAAYFRESDNENSTIDISLSDSDRQILRASGSDRLKATKSGVTFVGRDSSTGLARGQYVKIDTTVSGEPYTYYRYAPGDTAAFYTATFSFVGVGQGDYLKESIGNFRWVGPKKGSYLPLQFLPLPSSHDLVDVGIKARVANAVSLTGEYALSRFDANKFSNLPGTQTNGSALNLFLKASPKDVMIGEKNIGSFDAEFRERFLDGGFVPIDRANDIEFNRKWDIQGAIGGSEEIREGRLVYQPLSTMRLGGGLGLIQRGDVFFSNRGEALFTLKPAERRAMDYSLEDIKSSDYTIDSRGSWLRQRGITEYSLGGVIPGFQFESERRESRSLTLDTLKSGSFQYSQFTPRLEIPDFMGMSLRSEFQYRNEDSLLAGNLARAFQSFSQKYQWRLKEWQNLTSTLDLTIRNAYFTEEFKRRGNSDAQTLLLRSQSKFFPLRRALDTDLFYEVATQRSAKLERVFVRVPKGTGNYRYLGDLNGNGTADENEFELTRFDGDYVVITIPTDALFPVIDLKASSRVRLTPSRLMDAGQSTLGDILRSISTETYLRVEERSTEPDLKQIYLLHLSKFQNDSTTIIGNKQITQDIYVFENDPDLSFRFRFAQRNGFTQFALANERGLFIERSARIRTRLVREFATQFDVIRKIDRLTATRTTNRERNIAGTTLVSDFSYRPQQNIEVGFRLEVTRSTDSFPDRPLTADINVQNIRIVYSLETRGQLRGEIEREEVNLDGPAATLPFELTAGKLVGKSWLWRLNLDYRVADFVQATVGYDGRSEGGRQAVHAARAEVRAFF